ncbi:uncharacterized protein BP5553_03616 [Venustampulla echinocandica]|uniref:Uncharacterized protein n=1 Tax=Venustampulla echinocandica TaxID=2656787 RepID=A0A370TUS4_9HELO|nr:uncharacterized protein BP5553_03616 [Venustampulla echinocandica]RDL39276.1 hypothetical protein BP5553_03616 [Venustampulla echinocandica]
MPPTPSQPQPHCQQQPQTDDPRSSTLDPEDLSSSTLNNSRSSLTHFAPPRTASSRIQAKPAAWTERPGLGGVHSATTYKYPRTIPSTCTPLLSSPPSVVALGRLPFHPHTRNLALGTLDSVAFIRIGAFCFATLFDMATAAALPAPATDRSALKPARSMTHTFRDHRASTGRTVKRKPKPGQPFDPEDLTRRLTVVIEDQKAKTERRRAARAAKVASTHQDVIYHHVPTVAAAAFERTATPDTLRQVHKLARPAARAHFDVLQTENQQLGYAATALQKTQAIDQVMVERELTRSRNQFQWSPEMEGAAEADFGRDLYKPPQRTFTTHLKNGQGGPRPMSTGDIFSEDDEISVITKSKTRPLFDANDRNNWVQQDDNSESGQQKKEWSSPFLRKKHSSWIMRVRRDKSVRRDKDDEAAGSGDSCSPPDSNKGGKTRFLDRFKRHPS